MCENNKSLFVDITVVDNVNNIEEKNSYELTLDQYERILKIVEE